MITTLHFLLAACLSLTALSSRRLLDIQQHHHRNRRCPVSSQFDHQTDYFYPLDIYFNFTGSMPNVSCPSVDRDYVATPLFCPSNAVACPIREFAGAVTSGSDKWRKSYSMCQLKYHLSNSSETVRLVLMGGSAGMGAKSQGCCSRPECTVNVVYDDNTQFCAWSRQFATWLNNSHAANVKWINFASGGYATETTYRLVKPRIGGIIHFSSRDIVFLDHSTNDANVGSHMTPEVALESLLRKILLNSASPTDYPMIVLTETDCRNQSRGYTAGYHEVAAHYGIRLYSLYDAVHGIEPVDSVDRRIQKHLVEDGQVRREREHPPWHVHLYMADVFAHSFHTEMVSSDCPADGAHKPQEPLSLPPPLLSTAENRECSGAPLLLKSYDTEMDKTLASPGSVVIPPGSGWEVRKDRKGRGGFIRELNASSTCEENDASIVFKLNATAAKVAKSRHNIVMQLVFLKSYWNSGMATAYFCGHAFANFDAVWDDFQTFHYTLPYVTVLDLPVTHCADSSSPNAPAELVFKHNVVGCSGHGGKVHREPPYQNQLFKIVSVEVCNYR